MAEKNKNLNGSASSPGSIRSNAGRILDRRRFLSSAALALVWCGVLCAQNPSSVSGQTVLPVRTASTVPGPVVPDGLGVNIHFTNPRPGEMRMLAATGVRWIRMDFAWGATETKKGQYNFASYIRLITALRRYHIRPLLILDYGNPLYQHGAFPTTPTARHAFAQWAATAVKTFSGQGVMWEMWNEPDGGMGNNGLGPVHPSAYAKLAAEVGRAIHRADPHALYVGPALAWMQRPWKGKTWAQRIFRDGVLAEFAAVTVHPYRQTPPETAIADYTTFRKLIARYAPAGKVVPLLSSEWGYPSAPKWFFGTGYTDAGQARRLAREFLVNLCQEIPISIWYDWHNDGPSGPTPPASGSVEIAHIAALASSKAVEHLNLFTNGHGWVFNSGPEFPGAKGGFDIGKDGPTSVGILKYNFDGGGNYVGAICNVSLGKINTLSFKIKSARRQSVQLRIVDASGQWLQSSPLTYSNVNHWQTLRVNLTRGFPQVHWGGSNNGVIDFPIVTICVDVNNLMQHPNPEYHFGMVKYRYHLHRRWV
ncbi:MAG: cellulase family glycosylhydrolase, partial [Phycisphaerae bacterium]